VISSLEVTDERLSIKSKSDLEFSQSRHVREKKAELPCGNRSAEAEYFFDEHNAECGHYRQTLMNHFEVYRSSAQTVFRLSIIGLL